jgi:ABC-type branched-subunit amino acid transport system substrate-binding protein
MAPDVRVPPPAPAPAAPPAVSAVVAAPKPAEPPPRVVRGVTDHEIVLGMATAISGSAKEYGRQMKLGIESAFQRANDRGGVNGRQLRLVTVDDGYEPARTIPAMKELYEHVGAFGIMGNFGTATANVAVPFALEHKMLFFGAQSGATLLRRDPPDRYVFNYRASYAEEAAAIASYLLRVRRIRPERIAVLAQDDPFGESVYASLSKTLRAMRPDAAPLFRVTYQRNTVDVKDAAAQIRARGVPTDAVVLLAITRPAARFIEQMTGWTHGMQFITGSWTDSAGLAEELKMIGLRSAGGVVITQVVPSADSSATAVLEFKAAMAKYNPEERIDGTALEGYLMANVLIEALQRAGRELDTEGLVTALEAIHGFDLGIGTPIAFSAAEHQGSHRVWGLQLDGNGHYQQIDLE